MLWFYYTGIFVIQSVCEPVEIVKMFFTYLNHLFSFVFQLNPGSCTKTWNFLCTIFKFCTTIERDLLLVGLQWFVFFCSSLHWLTFFCNSLHWLAFFAVVCSGLHWFAKKRAKVTFWLQTANLAYGRFFQTDRGGGENLLPCI